jgi:transcriptional regulator with PAS, ATPase and Fis domain
MSHSDVTTSPPSEERTQPESRCAEAFVKVVWSNDRERIGRRELIGDRILLVGREQEGGGLGIADPRLSRVHARLSYDVRADAMRIGDAGSRNGTFVNARRVDTTLLNPGDVIRVGDTVLVYEERDRLAELRAHAAGAARLAATVLLRGESGSGKELLARSIHAESGRSGPFVPVNCAGVPIELLSAELFGHTKQAFSGATQGRKGLFVEASGGTLFLDEIGDCPAPVQVALLRALQEKAVRPVGADREVPVDLRVVAATHMDLEAAIGEGRFRADLYARLSQLTLTIPPLRERRGEVVELMTTFAAEHDRALTLSADAAEALACWHWPLNVRELQSLVHGCIMQGALAGPLRIDQLHELNAELARPVKERRATGGSDGVSSSTLPPAAANGRKQVRELLENHGGNVSAVAAELGKPRAQVYRWLRSMGLSADKFRK